MTGLFQDLRFAIHSLNRDRRFTLLAVLALALGIGSVTVIFSAVYGVLIDTFPYAHYDRMVSFSMDEPGQQGLGRETMTIPELLDFRDQNHVFADMEGGTSTDVHYIHGNQTTQWSVTRETANGYQFLGVQPLFGRLIKPVDTKPGAPPVFMMTYQVWRISSMATRIFWGKHSISTAPFTHWWQSCRLASARVGQTFTPRFRWIEV